MPAAGDVKKIVSINASAPSVVPLLPISTGGNWGLGGHPYSTIPSAVVDMRLMAAIRAVDTDTGVAVIEPGVTMMVRHDRRSSPRESVTATLCMFFQLLLFAGAEQGAGSNGMVCQRHRLLRQHGHPRQLSRQVAALLLHLYCCALWSCHRAYKCAACMCLCVLLRCVCVCVYVQGRGLPPPAQRGPDWSGGRARQW